MKKARWIVQKNLLAENDLNQIKKACEKYDVEYFDTLVIPFTKELPEFPMDDEYENIYYGSTTFMNNLYKELNPKGLFFNKNFSIKNYCKQWNRYMLNIDADFITIQELFDSTKYGDEENIFIRPDGDGKEFDGQVVKFKNAKGFLKRHIEYDSSLDYDTKIVVCEPYNIKKEWRCIIADGRVVTSSMYRKDFKLHKSNTDIPQSMIDFAEERAKEYAPHDIFAMDIALVNNDGIPTYYIIECGCANSVGFYFCDIEKIILSLTNYIEKS